MQKRFFIVKKGYLNYLNVLQKFYFRNCSLKSYFGEPKWFYASLQKQPFGTFIFKSVKPDIFDIVGTSLPSPARAETILKYELMFI